MLCPFLPYLLSEHHGCPSISVAVATPCGIPVVVQHLEKFFTYPVFPRHPSWSCARWCTTLSRNYSRKSRPPFPRFHSTLLWTKSPWVRLWVIVRCDYTSFQEVVSVRRSFVIFEWRKSRFLRLERLLMTNNNNNDDKNDKWMPTE